LLTPIPDSGEARIEQRYVFGTRERSETVANRRDVMSATTTNAMEDGASKKTIREYLEGEEGLTTAEYAVGTVAVAGLGGVLIKLLTSEAVRDLIWTVVQGAFNAMLGA
jgi:hypothetical protein